jgi:PBP1b-binding outer membrane lipoprotein LpoB
MIRLTDHLVRSRLLAASVITATLLVVGCNSSAPAPTAESEPAVAAEPVAAEPEAGVPKIAAAEAVFDVGSIKPTDKIEHVFKIANAGTADLKIERVQRT